MILALLALAICCGLFVVFVVTGLWVLAALTLALLAGLVLAVCWDAERPPRDGRFAGGTPSDERLWRP